MQNLPLGPGVTLAASDDNGLLALAKPAGVLSHPNQAADQARSLLNAPYTLDGEFYELAIPSVEREGKPQRVYLLNRLDSATSGVLLLATSAALAKVVRAAFLEKNVKKIYNALVFGTPQRAVETWRDQLAIHKKSNQIRAERGGNIPAEARVRILRRWHDKLPPLTLLELEPRTGRSHQLRVQCALRKLPIVGDATYGNFPANRDHARRTGNPRLYLHSLETRFTYLWKNKQHTFAAQAPLPPEFLAGQ
jgi:23S rRNA-/tRNA-specific pseudouridylate synthase